MAILIRLASVGEALTSTGRTRARRAETKGKGMIIYPSCCFLSYIIIFMYYIYRCVYWLFSDTRANMGITISRCRKQRGKEGGREKRQLAFDGEACLFNEHISPPQTHSPPTTAQTGRERMGEGCGGK